MDDDELEEEEGYSFIHPLAEFLQHQHEERVHAHMATNSRTADLRRFILQDADRDALTAVYYLVSSITDMPDQERLACAAHYSGVILAALEFRFGVSMADLMTDEERMALELDVEGEDSNEPPSA